MSQIISDTEFVECRLCGLKAAMLTTSHFKHKHGISFKEYQDKFPDAATMTLSKQTERRLAVSSSTKGRTAHNKGKPISIEQKSKQSKSMKQKFASGELAHWNTGNTLSSEHKAKIASSLVDHYITLDASTKAEIQHKRDQEFKNRISSGWVSPLKGVKLTGDHLESSRKSIKIASDAKHKATWDAISTKCNEYGLILVNRLENNYVELSCTTCQTTFSFHYQIFRNSKSIGNKICPTCYPRLTGTSKGEKELLDYIKTIYSGTIIANDHSVLGFGGEIDIYLPDVAIAIEYDGLYWHSESVHGIPKNLSVKTKKLNNKGIRVIHVFEDEWEYKTGIVKSRISQILGKTNRRLHARKLVVKPITSNDRDKFLEENHIQGTDIAKHRYGAYSEDELVAVMTFKPTNFIKGGDGSVMELSRFAVKIDVHIPGIANKLFKHFVKLTNVSTVISYADSRWSEGNLYRMLGFVEQDHTPPNYWYFKSNDRIRIHRSNFMKHTLVKNGHDPNKSEFVIMESSGYLRIYDCGNSKWLWENIN